MRTQVWNRLLSLLSLMILVDGRVVEDEVRVFALCALRLRDALDPDIMLTPRMARDWFTAHQTEIAEADRDALVAGILDDMHDVPEAARLLRALVAIADADGVRHEMEDALIDRVEAWDAGRDLAGD